MVWGRGGAGNIQQVQEQSQRAKEDIEANHSPSSSTTSSVPASSTQTSEYAHTGRGGAGNWFQPTTLSQTGTFTTPSDATSLPIGAKPQVSTPWHPDTQELPVARAGRGGAGNFVWKDEDAERKRREEEEKEKERVAEKIARDVEEGLKKPGAAVLGSEKAGRGW